MPDEPRSERKSGARKIWLLSPVYLDSECYALLHEQLNRVLDDSDRFADFERRFVVLDDSAGGDLKTAELASLPGVEVLTPPFNLGHQRGLVYTARLLAPEMADEDLVVTLDADGEDKPEDVPRLLEALEDPPVEVSKVVLARRTSRRSATFLFRALYPLFRLVFRAVTGVWVSTGNFAAFNGLTAKRLLLHPSFDTCYSSSLIAMDCPRTLIDCDRGDRYLGQSRMGYSKLSLHALRMLMPFTERIARRTLLLFLSILMLAAVIAVVVLAVRLFTDSAIPGWATYTLLALGIVILVSLGNLLILFTVFSHSRAISLSSLESFGMQRSPEIDGG